MALSHDALLRRGGSQLFLSLISGLLSQEVLSARGKSETLEVGFLKLGKAAGVFLSTPTPM